MQAHSLLRCLYVQSAGARLPLRPRGLWAKLGAVTWWRTGQLSGAVGTPAAQASQIVGCTAYTHVVEGCAAFRNSETLFMTWNEGVFQEVLREKAKRKGMFIIYHLPCEKQENNQQEGGARTHGLVLQRTGWGDQEFRAE